MLFAFALAVQALLQPYRYYLHNRLEEGMDAILIGILVCGALFSLAASDSGESAILVTFIFLLALASLAFLYVLCVEIRLTCCNARSNSRLEDDYESTDCECYDDEGKGYTTPYSDSEPRSLRVKRDDGCYFNHNGFFSPHNSLAENVPGAELAVKGEVLMVRAEDPEIRSEIVSILRENEHLLRQIVQPSCESESSSGSGSSGSSSNTSSSGSRTRWRNGEQWSENEAYDEEAFDYDYEYGSQDG